MRARRSIGTVGSASPVGWDGHVALVSSSSEGLLPRVAEALLAGLCDGDALVVVARAAHRDVIEGRLRTAGFDVRQESLRSRYVALDADETLTRCMVDGAPDPERVRAVIGAALDGACGGRSVRIYGEMVDVLWERGEVTAALGLEDLWNAYGAAREFSLLCGYTAISPQESTDGPFAEACAAHTAVITADPPRREEPFAVASSTAQGHGPTGETSFEVSLMAKVLGALYLAGGTLALLTVLLPHPSRGSPIALLVIVANAYLVSVMLIWHAGRVPRRLLGVMLAWGTTLITGVAYFSGARPSPLIFFYLWVFLYSSYFFTRRQAITQIAYCGAAYGVLLAIAPPPEAVTWWIVAMGSLLVAAAIVWLMRERLESLIDRLQNAARTDPLTRLFNRRAYRELLDIELDRARRNGETLTVISGDLDQFKLVNDRGGHRSGDAVLQRVARVLETTKRQSDTIARVGGEEFALIAPDTDTPGGLTLAERLRHAVLEEFTSDRVPMTISFGIATFPTNGETAASLLHAADDALYQAKNSGRNRSVAFQRQMTTATHGRTPGGNVEGERFIAVMIDLAALVDLRFSGSARHSETVGRYAEMMARELGLSEDRVSRVRLAGLLHDIGKVTLPDSILKKPGPLDPAERRSINTHPAIGAQIIDHQSLADVRAWVAAHHECHDGSGYPAGLAGHDIPLEARILAVADAYEAMTSDRAYRAAVTPAAACAELLRCANSQFDPTVVNALLTAIARAPHEQTAGRSDPESAAELIEADTNLPLSARAR